MPVAQLRRRERLRPAIAALGADAALITCPANVRYLSGLASSNAALLVPAAPPGTSTAASTATSTGTSTGTSTATSTGTSTGTSGDTGMGGTILATDSRYAGTARQDCPDLEILIERYIEPALARVAATLGVRRLAFEAQEMTVERYEAFAAAVPGTELVALGRAVEEIRMAKDEKEIALIARACEITSRAFEEILPLIGPGVTERELAISLERAMTDLGADGLAFDTIVASGPNGAIPHHVPSGRPFAAGDMITVDCGARYQGYHADMTRTVVLGAPAAWQRDIYALVAQAQAAGIDAAVPGADVQDVDAAARDLIEGAGYGGQFQHGLGHGVGLEIHEAPILGYGRTGTLGDRVPITVEPGIYLPGQGGVRIEDTLVVRAGTGTAASQELLTTTTRELLVL
jgi:Xaa-Pro aminopeptidase